MDPRTAWIFSDDSGEGKPLLWASAIHFPDSNRAGPDRITAPRKRNIPDAVATFKHSGVFAHVGYIDGNDSRIQEFLSRKPAFWDPRRDDLHEMTPRSYLLGTITSLVCTKAIASSCPAFDRYFLCVDKLSMSPGHLEEFKGNLGYEIRQALQVSGVNAEIKWHSDKGAPGAGLPLRDTVVSELARCHGSTNLEEHPLLKTGSVTCEDMTRYCLKNIRSDPRFRDQIPT